MICSMTGDAGAMAKRPAMAAAPALMLALAMMGGLPAYAVAQESTGEGPLGIAFAEAPEMGGGVCHSANADEGLACARAKCASDGAAPADCLRTAWCYPAGWSADLFMQHREGPHWHRPLCGWQSREDLEAAIRIACEGSAAAYLIECTPVAIWAPDGSRLEPSQ